MLFFFQLRWAMCFEKFAPESRFRTRHHKHKIVSSKWMCPKALTQGSAGGICGAWPPSRPRISNVGRSGFPSRMPTQLGWVCQSAACHAQRRHSTCTTGVSSGLRFTEHGETPVKRASSVLGVPPSANPPDCRPGAQGEFYFLPAFAGWLRISVTKIQRSEVLGFGE